MAAWHGEPERSRAFHIFLAVYIAAMLGVVYIVVHGLWTEVVNAWPK